MDGFEQSLGVGRTAHEVGGLLQRLEILQGEHDHRLIAVAGNDDRCVVGANPVHRRGEVLTSCRVADCVHVGQDAVHIGIRQLPVSRGRKEAANDPKLSDSRSGSLQRIVSRCVPVRVPRRETWNAVPTRGVKSE